VRRQFKTAIDKRRVTHPPYNVKSNPHDQMEAPDSGSGAGLAQGAFPSMDRARESRHAPGGIAI